MFIQLTEELIVTADTLKGIVLVAAISQEKIFPVVTADTLKGIVLAAISQEKIFPDEAEEWVVRAILAFSGEGEVEHEVLFTGNRQEAREFLKICASYLNQAPRRGLIPLHEVGLMVNPTPLSKND